MNDMRIFHHWWITLCLSIIWVFGAREASGIASPESGVAVVYLVKNSLRVWSIGQYGPITGLEEGVFTGTMPSENYARLLCDNAELAQNVTAVRDVVVEGGYLKISYSQGSGPDKTVLACERGLPRSH